MKNLYKHLLLLLVFGQALPVIGQGTLQSSDIVPQIGDSYLIHHFRINGENSWTFFLDYGIGYIYTGDYAYAQLNGDYFPAGSSVVEFLDPASTPYYSSFPNSTIVAKRDSVYEYYELANNKLSIVGIDSGQFLVNFSMPQVLYEFPVTLGQFTAMADSFHYSSPGIDLLESYGRVGLDPFRMTDTVHTPAGSFNDAVWVLHSLGGEQTRNQTTTYTFDDYLYSWYLQGTRFPIMYMRRVYKFDGATPNCCYWYGAYLDPMSVNSGDRKDWEIGFSVYHDQAAGQIVCHVRHHDPSEGKVMLLDMRGQELSSKVFSSNPGITRISVPTDGLSAGVYLVSLQLDGKKVSKRIALF